jgi:cellulose synthase (UDP-forming)
MVAAFVGTAAWYFIWRLSTFNPAHLLWSRGFLVLEAVGFLWSLLFLLTVMRLSEWRIPPPLAEAAVDVVVTTYNEPLDIVRRTLMAARDIRYPHETWLLDDGARDEMQQMAESLGCRYLARRDNRDAKAGNLNNALRHLRGEFIAMFDADHVADPAFLSHTLGFFRDERLAFVQTPQEFVNLDSYQHFRTTDAQRPLHEQSLFFHIIQRGRDLVNAAMLCGTCAVVRRAALDEIGGFATGSVTEDMKTSVRLHAAGWKSIFTPQVLSAGLAPFDGSQFRRQRLRWAQGAMQVLVQEGVIGSSRLSAGQRLHYFLHAFNQIEGWRNAAMFFLPAIVLFTAFTPIVATPLAYLIHFVPYFAACIFAYEGLGRGYARFVESETYNLARCSIAMRATFALLQHSLPFRVTRKTRSHRVDWAGMSLPLSVMLATMAGLAEALARAFEGTSRFPNGSLGVIVIWACMAMYIAGRAIARILECNRDRRTSPRFVLGLDAKIDGVRARVRAVSCDGITIESHASLQGSRTIDLELGGRHFILQATLQPRHGSVSGGALVWHDGQARAIFDLALHQALIRSIASPSPTETYACESFITSPLP